MAVTFDRIIPILRIFSIGKAKEFYVDFLGFTIDWEHRFEDKAPWKAKCVEVIDPFGNHLRFNEYIKA
jgi:hypothetical protein